MKRARTILLFSSLCFTCFSSYAQVIPVKNAFQSSLANVVGHYPNNSKILRER